MCNYPLNQHATPMYVTVDTEYMDSLHKIKADAGIVGFDKVKNIASALANAKIKHPKFCDVMTICTDIVTMTERVNAIKNYNDHKCDKFSAEYILDEEIAEALEQHLLGNKKECIDELYQVIAVTLRMIEFVEAN